MAVRKKLAAVLTMVALAVGVSSAQASVVINGTRVVYPSDEREVTVKLVNEGAGPALVQAWLDTGDPATLPEDAKVPFSLSPPLFRLDSKKGQSLRLVYSQEPLAQDRETLYWLNVLEVPPLVNGPAAEKNSLQVAFRTRIKVFFRPAGLPGNSREAPAQITWKFVKSVKGGYALQATNPTPYYVTFAHVGAKAGGKKWFNEKGGMVDPGSTAEFAIESPAPSVAVPEEVDYRFVDDYGAGVDGIYRAPGTR
ncbi:fimbria/pilus periplasmic chaperone [Paraburkholderia sp. CNPSo 3157]|uniref:Fimbria/pilus periplasmic chaperone n=1 Tax=Paraburkholderia franconis TaxID=2654983 RepID=A0A7X1N768_9BURK|nr:fimbria/pilus periplasmic chaperone [Paraburkholderia franconis]MPW16599.1 fimbria/pilus periplasmic chaperone [Paraburkholderia franconis]